MGQAWGLRSFRERLRELGWSEGANIAIETRWAENKPERLPALAAELAQRRVDIIVTQTTLAAHVAKKATSTIPIVMAGSNDPVVEGLVASLTRPGGNMTGVMHSPRGIGFKIMQLLTDAVPRATRIAALLRATDGPVEVEAFDSFARDLGIRILLPQAGSRMEVPEALDAAARWGANAVYAPPTALNDPAYRLIAGFARQHRWPSIGGAREFPLAGGLMSYFASWLEIRRQAADYVDKILRGANPADLPIQQPTKFELVVNLRTARELGLTLSPSLRLRADELIQ